MVEVPSESQLAEEQGEDPHAEEDSTGTVLLTPEPKGRGDDTVLLESVQSLQLPKPIAVSDVVEVTEAVADEPPQDEDDVDAILEIIEEEPDTEFRTAERLEETELDMTPMVDVTFLLLIFFMVTAAFALQKSIEVPKPQEDQASENVVEEDIEDNPDYVSVRVDEFNTYWVTTVDWEEEAPSVQDLHIRLRRARDGDSTGTIPTKLLVEAHGDALHGRVVAALDAGTATGFEEVQLTTFEEDT
jgi:biopolymer transport protein ExbD